ncbi:MAG: RNA polymerase sigma factor [Bacteroidales bacterium]|nr:RNA polymerase sigma factor [Bacteroidales bacterium]
MTDYLTEAFLRIKERLLGGSKRMLRDTASSEDALQDAFVKLWGRYQIRSPQEAESLLQRTVRNNSVDMLRRRKTVPLEVDVTQEETPVEEREQLFLKIEELVRKDLSDVQQYIIRRHEYEGAKLETIARELGMNPPAVRMQLSRARKTIRDRYNEQELL